jgi:hypothetical protein
MPSKQALPTEEIDMVSRDDTGRAFRAVSKGFAVLCIGAVAGLAHGCTEIVARPIGSTLSEGPGALGDPCLPDLEKGSFFAGFSVAQLSVVSNDFNACQTGICLINHFQGRVSCPLGQAAPEPCKGPNDLESCPGGKKCVEAGVVPVFCEAGVAGQCDAYGGVCNTLKGACECSADAHCPEGTTCDVATKECKRYVCQNPTAGCQSPEATDDENAGKACCTPGTTTPVTAAVCGQCSEISRRDASAVYCSCRCGPAEGAPPENVDWCTCPDGFECKELLPYVGLGDESVAGKYCIKAGTAYSSQTACGVVKGYADPTTCQGVPAPP